MTQKHRMKERDIVSRKNKTEVRTGQFTEFDELSRPPAKRKLEPLKKKERNGQQNSPSGRSSGSGVSFGSSTGGAQRRGVPERGKQRYMVIQKNITTKGNADTRDSNGEFPARLVPGTTGGQESFVNPRTGKEQRSFDHETNDGQMT